MRRERRYELVVQIGQFQVHILVHVLETELETREGTRN